MKGGLPSNSNIIYASAKVHTGGVGAPRHRMPYDATEETQESKACEEQFRGINDVIGIDQWYGIDSPKEEWD